MKDKWLKDIHDRMADFNIDEPDRLWEDIEASGILDRISRRNRHRHAIIASTKRICAAAAVVAIAILTGTQFYNGTPDLAIPKSIASPTADNNKTEEKNKKNDNSYEAIAPTPRKTATYKTTLASYYEAPSDEVPSVDNKRDEEKTPADKNDMTDLRSRPDTAKVVHEKSRKTYRDLTYAAVRPRIDRRVSVSIHTSGGTGNKSNHKDLFSGALSAVGPDDDYWDSNPSLDMLVFNKGQEVHTEINHNLPIRTGISVSYAITDRLTVESGLTYTYLSSDIKESSNNHCYSGKQELHYVGIPANIKYRICSWKAIDLYASGGFLAEKCISGKLNKEYSLDNNNLQSTSERLTVKQLQWSANASAGVQCNLTDAVGLYAEPGISYYFDNGSSVRTIYSDKPLNFNLNLGLRFTLGR